MDITKIIQQAKDHILENGEYMPTLFVELDDEEALSMVVFADFPETSLKKQKHLFLVGRKFGKEHSGREVKQLCLITEAWMSVRNSEQEFNNCSPSEDPNRKEVLIAQILEVRIDHTLSQKLQTIEMLRDGQGNLLDLLVLNESQDARGNLLLSFIAGFVSAEMSESDMFKLMMQHQIK